ncbi:MAG: hypothetical protein JO368_02345, partial [Acidimicrobiales bacterium]|nr:hypothetical protein [Acidimicrobiales bacterium]
TVAVSLSWMTVVSLTPQHDRPYVDGTTNDSLVTQVFDYNGFGRVGRPSPNQVLGRTLGVRFLALPTPSASADRLVRGAPGRDTGWLLPAAVLSIPVILWARRRRPRTDLVRAAGILWSVWLVVFGGFLSVSAINTYYLGALSPPIAALVGVTGWVLWTGRRSRPVQAVAASIVVVTVATAAWILPGRGTGLPDWLASLTVGLGILALATIAWWAATGRPSAGRAAAVCVGITLVAVPLAASASVVANDLGSFDTPFQPVGLTVFNRAFFGAPLRPVATLPTIERVRYGAADLLATQTSVVAAPFVFATGQEVLPIGGYDGATPVPRLAALRTAVSRGQFHLVLAAPHTSDPRIRWIAAHCNTVHPGGPAPAVSLAVYYCQPLDAG